MAQSIYQGRTPTLDDNHPTLGPYKIYILSHVYTQEKHWTNKKKRKRKYISLNHFSEKTFVHSLIVLIYTGSLGTLAIYKSMSIYTAKPLLPNTYVLL